MKADRFKGTKMRFVLENPPFGTAWGGNDAADGVEDAVNEEYKKGFDGRWGAGLPGAGHTEAGRVHRPSGKGQCPARALRDQTL